MVTVTRAYDPPATGRGARVLVDRLWPRGVRKEALGLTEWLRDVAPSTELRHWYGHDPEKFADFEDRYRAELADPPASDALARLREYAATGPLTLVTAVKDLDLAHTAVLLEVLAEDGRAAGRGPGTGAR